MTVIKRRIYGHDDNIVTRELNRLLYENKYTDDDVVSVQYEYQDSKSFDYFQPTKETTLITLTVRG